MNDKNNMLALSQERFFGSQVYSGGGEPGGSGLYHGVCAPGTIGSEQAALALAHCALRKGEEETAGLLRPRMVQDGSYVYYRYEKRE